MAFLPLASDGRGPHDDAMTENSALPLTHVVVFDGFDDLDAIGPLEVLTAAGFAAHVVRPAGHAIKVHSAHGLVLEVPDELGAAELVVVPGGGDQWEIANRVVRQGSASLIRPLTAEALVAEVTEVLSTPRYRDAARRAAAGAADVADPVQVCHDALA